MNKFFKYIAIFFFSGIIFSCANDEEEEVAIPDYLLSEEQYVKLLVDYSLAESAGNLNIKGLSGLRFDSAYAFNPLKENNISQSRYDSSISFYSKHPKLYKKIFDEVLTELSKMQAQRTVKKDSISKKDSLLKIVKKDSIVKKQVEIKKASIAKKDSVTKKDSLIKKTKPKSTRRKKKKKAVK